MIHVNIRGVLHGIAAVLPRMEAQGSRPHRQRVLGRRFRRAADPPPSTPRPNLPVRAISEGLRKESDRIRCTCIYPGVVESELANTISDPGGTRADGVVPQDWRSRPTRSGASILYAIEQPADVDVNEIVVRRQLATLV